VEDFLWLEKTDHEKNERGKKMKGEKEMLEGAKE